VQDLHTQVTTSATNLLGKMFHSDTAAALSSSSVAKPEEFDFLGLTAPDKDFVVNHIWKCNCPACLLLVQHMTKKSDNKASLRAALQSSTLWLRKLNTAPAVLTAQLGPESVAETTGARETVDFPTVFEYMFYLFNTDVMKEH
jgi:hypothetical protein